MSSYPPPGPPPGPPSGGQPGAPIPEPPQKPNAVVLGALIGLLVVVLVALVAVGVKVIDDATSKVEASSDGGPPPTPTVDAAPMPQTDPALARFYGQELRWRDCGSDARCTTLEVPLDYAKPDGDTIRLAVLKVPADRQKSKVGALVVNPGGPGGSGVQYAQGGGAQFGSVLADYFDIVGFDPRGVGDSDPVQCLDTKGLDRLLAYDPDPDDQAERDGMDSLIRGFGQGCLARSGDLARHVSTKEAARDMDVLRAALKQPKLDYLGASYGTLLGATYADLFPANVGRFVLDGAIDPSLSNEQLSLQQGQGFETALRAYVKDCVATGNCVLGTNVDAGTKKIRGLLDELDREPLRTGESRELTEGLGMLGIWMPLYVKEYWPALTAALTSAFDGDGSKLLALADIYASRDRDRYADNSMEALYAVNCLDHSDSVPTSQVPSYFAAFEKASPTFGRAFAFSLSTCASWPIQSGERTVALHAKGAPPIVVIGTTRDPATPYRWAKALASQLDSGRLITRDGDGHTGFQRGNGCVNGAVERWLVQGKAPRPGLSC